MGGDTYFPCCIAVRPRVNEISANPRIARQGGCPCIAFIAVLTALGRSTLYLNLLTSEERGAKSVVVRYLWSRS
jgi:hypothetical protein